MYKRYMLLLICIISSQLVQAHNITSPDIMLETEVTTLKNIITKDSTIYTTKSDSLNEITKNITLRVPEHNIILLKIPYQCCHMDCLTDVLLTNSKAAFTICNAFVVQPWFKYTQYDVTGTCQTYANNGILYIPADLKSFVNGIGTEPYMYVMKICFLINGTQYNLTLRNDFCCVAQPTSHAQTCLNDMLTTLSGYIITGCR